MKQRLQLNFFIVSKKTLSYNHHCKKHFELIKIIFPKTQSKRRLNKFEISCDFATDSIKLASFSTNGQLKMFKNDFIIKPSCQIIIKNCHFYFKFNPFKRSVIFDAFTKIKK